MNHGFCKTPMGRTLLGFTNDAPVFKNCVDVPLHFLVEAKDTDVIVGYSVVEVGDNHGFLFYPVQKYEAEAQAVAFSQSYKKSYVCLPLSIGTICK